MVFKVTKRSAQPPRDPSNRTSIEQLVTAVNELTGAVGADVNRAIRVGELLGLGVLEYDEARNLILPSGALSLPSSYMGRNRLINGNLDWWQRGSNFTTTTSVYTADRWLTQASASTIAASRQNFPDGQSAVPNGPTYFLRATVTSVAGAGNYATIRQRIEGVRTLQGQVVTLSFWAKADAARSISNELVQRNGTTDVTGIGVNKFNLTTSWNYYSYTFKVPIFSGAAGSNYLDVFFWLDAGSSFNSRTNSLGQQSGVFDFAQMQLEAGESATSFDLRHISDELLLCQRYFFRSGNFTIGDYGGAYNGVVAANSTAIVGGAYPFPTTMRAIPAVATFNPNDGSTNTGRQSGTGNTVYTSILVGPNGISQVSLAAPNTAGRDFLFQFTADAEI